MERTNLSSESTKSTALLQRIYKEPKSLGIALLCIGVGAAAFFALSKSLGYGPKVKGACTVLGGAVGGFVGYKLLGQKSHSLDGKGQAKKGTRGSGKNGISTKAPSFPWKDRTPSPDANHEVEYQLPFASVTITTPISLEAVQDSQWKEVWRRPSGEEVDPKDKMVIVRLDAVPPPLPDWFKNSTIPSSLLPKKAGESAVVWALFRNEKDELCGSRLRLKASDVGWFVPK